MTPRPDIDNPLRESAEAFAAKYTLLLHSALQLSPNNHADAEDLVQEAFVRLLLSGDALEGMRDLDAVLYAHLVSAHLAKQRREQDYSFQTLFMIDFDPMLIRMREADAKQQLHLHNQLRRVVAYLLLRRRTAKFASIFILRFFHGYLPEEIVRLCRIGRHAVDLSLRYARKEIKPLLTGPPSSACGTYATPAYETSHTLLSTHALIEDLRRTIFASPLYRCPTMEQLQRRYGAVGTRPLDSMLLAHLVTCARCLDRAAGISGIQGQAPADRRKAAYVAPFAGGTSALSMGSRGVLPRCVNRAVLVAPVLPVPAYAVRQEPPRRVHLSQKHCSNPSPSPLTKALGACSDSSPSGQAHY